MRWKSDYGTSLFLNISIVWIIFINREKIINSLFILYRILTENLELLNRELQSITLQLLYNILRCLSVACLLSLAVTTRWNSVTTRFKYSFALQICC